MNQKQANEYLNKLQAGDPAVLARLEPWEKAVLQNVAETDKAVGQARNRLQDLLRETEGVKEGITKLTGKMEGYINLLVGSEAERQSKAPPVVQGAPLSLEEARQKFGADRIEVVGKDGQVVVPTVESKGRRK